MIKKFRELMETATVSKFVSAEACRAYRRGVAACIDIFESEQRTTINKPLTLNELQEMDKLPVWIDAHKEWFIVYMAHPDFGDCVVTRAGTYLPIKLAAKRRAYRFKPEECN